MKYLIPVYITTYIISLFVDVPGLYAGCPLYSYFTYSFLHGNVLHLAVNMIAIFTIARMMDKNMISNRTQILLILLGSILSGVLYNRLDIPTYGCSSGIYCTIGYLAISASWLYKPMVSVRMFSIAMFTILFMALVPNINTSLHFMGIAIGVSAAYIPMNLNISLWKKRNQKS